MKKVLAVLAVVGLMAAATSVSALSIKNTKHDLSSTSGGTQFKSNNTTQICVFCHTPHNSVTSGAQGGSYPLWNRTNPAAGGFDLYSSGSMDNTYNTGAPGYASDGFTTDSVSLYCMSCHDGVTSLGAVKNPPLDATAGITFPASPGDKITGDANLGTNSLMDDHPVNFGIVNGKDPEIGTVTVNKINTGRLTNSLPLYKSVRNADATLECASCHAVHNNEEGMFLRTTMTGSLLCLGCHIK